ncbi:ParM/StbA family protein [Aeromonas hydrophila]|uniref:ParM/StbA family protein n=1 Tax=Aeromonas hydrophila TaxID=644 RepID=UPI002B47B63F|nr:ParM/StbA family protein [Aeromonas hydrophila]
MNKQKPQQCIGIDNGSKQIKLYTMPIDEDGQLGAPIKSVTPSSAAAGFISSVSLEPESGDRDSYLTMNDSNQLMPYHVNSEKPENTTAQEYQYSEINRVLVHDILAKSGHGYEQCQVRACVGLPMLYYYNSEFEVNQQLVQRAIKNVMTDVYLPNGIERETGNKLYHTKPIVDMHSADVFAETVAAWIDDRMVFTDEGRLTYDREIIKQRRLYIDIGGNTTDLLLTNQDKIDRCSRSLMAGGIHLINDVTNMIASLTATAANCVPVDKVNKVLHGEAYSYRGQMLDFSKQVAEVKERFFSRLWSEIYNVIPQQTLNSLDAITFLGGTSEEYFDDIIRTSSVDGFAKLHPDPVFVNARAFFKRAYVSYKKEMGK